MWPGCGAHRSPLQAPPLEYQCSRSGNSSRTAIRGKKKKEKTTTAFCCRKAGCCCRTLAGKHNEQSYSHTKRTVQIFMIMDQISRVDVGAKNKKQKKKHRWFICSYCSKMCAAPEEGDKDTHLTSDCTLMSSSSISAHTMKTGIQCGKKLRPFT